MNLKGLKRKSALKFLQANKKSRNRKDLNSLFKIEKVGIVAEVDLFKTYDFTMKLSENLGVDKSCFDVLLYDNGNDEQQLTQYEYFSEKDFGFFGKIKTEQLRKFINGKYDLLIDYCHYEDVYSKIICSSSNARLVAGFEMTGFDAYDISIKLDSNRIDTFNEELTKYLKILKLID